MKTVCVAVLGFALFAGAVAASCPSKPPSTKTIEFAGGDQRVNQAWLEANLAGRVVSYSGGGKENYRKNGSYSYSEGSGDWAAPSYRFYDNGFRCIAYSPAPRFDYYVVNNGKLVLINKQGNRFEGKIRK